MPNPKEITHYCTACKTEHTFIENEWPFWNLKMIDEKPVFGAIKASTVLDAKGPQKKRNHQKQGKERYNTLDMC